MGWNEGTTYLSNSRVSGEASEESWVDARTRLMVIAPHPDDETLGAGGLLARAGALNIPVRIVFLTNGDGSRTTQLYRDFSTQGFSSGPEAYLSLATLRQAEAQGAAKMLGLRTTDLRFLGYPDFGLYPMWSNHWGTEAPYKSIYTQKTASPYANSPTPAAPYTGTAVVADLKREMEEFDPTLILTTHSADTHPDHAAAYDFTMAAREQILWEQGMARYIPIRTFLVHHGPWPAPTGRQEDAEMQPPAALTSAQGYKGTWKYTPLSAQEKAAKRAALDQYVTQLATTPYYLDSFVRRSELFAMMENSMVPFSGEKFFLGSQATKTTLGQKLMAAGDITQVEIAPGEKSGVQLNIELAANPVSWLEYDINLHHISARDRDVRPTRLTVAYRNDRWQLTSVNEGQAAAVGAIKKVYVVERVMQVPVPARSMTEGSVIVSITSRRGRMPVDKTISAVVRFGHPRY